MSRQPSDPLTQAELDEADQILNDAIKRAGGTSDPPPDRDPNEVLTGDDADVEE